MDLLKKVRQLSFHSETHSINFFWNLLRSSLVIIDLTNTIWPWKISLSSEFFFSFVRTGWNGIWEHFCCLLFYFLFLLPDWRMICGHDNEASDFFSCYWWQCMNGNNRRNNMSKSKFLVCRSSSTLSISRDYCAPPFPKKLPSD